MIIDKIINHTTLNKYAVKQIYNFWMGIHSRTPISKDSLDRLQTMENKASGYIARFGDKTILAKKMSQDRKSEEYLYLLYNLGQSIDKKDILQKALSSPGKKNKLENVKLLEMKSETEKEIKEWLLKIESYHLNKRLTEFANEDLNVEQDFHNKDNIVNNPIVEKSLRLRINPMVLAKIQPKPQIVLNKQKKNDELSDDFDFNLENTEIYTGYLDEERIQQEIEVVARREFNLKEVASTQRFTSVDGDIPRAIVTDLSFSSINNIVNSIDNRFNKPNQIEKPKTTKKGKEPKLNSHTALTTPKPSLLRMKKPTPEKMSALQGKSAKQLAMAVRAHQKTIEISKKFMFAQEQHLNYIDIERFELDEIQDRHSVYEAGAKNPLSGRIISSRIKNQYSDLRMDSAFKVRR